MSNNYTHGLTGRAIRIDEVEPRKRGRDYRAPLRLDQETGQVVFDAARALPALPTTATLADVIEFLNNMRRSDANDGLRQP